VNPGEVAGYDDAEAQDLIRRGAAEPLEGRAPAPERLVQEIDPDLEVLGATDRDPEWMERHQEAFEVQHGRKALEGPPADKMVTETQAERKTGRRR
jgi:hypothetical protein